MHANYSLWREIEDLLDDYRDEIYCQSRNGWNRYDFPENIRVKIDKKIKQILGVDDE